MLVYIFDEILGKYLIFVLRREVDFKVYRKINKDLVEKIQKNKCSKWKLVL